MPISFRFFLAEMLPVKFLTTFYVEEETIHAAPIVHGSYHEFLKKVYQMLYL
jgi:hypothetical protein